MAEIIELKIKTEKNRQVIDITDQVQQLQLLKYRAVGITYAQIQLFADALGRTALSTEADTR